MPNKPSRFNTTRICNKIIGRYTWCIDMNDTARIYIQRATDKLKQAYQLSLNDISSEDVKVNINEAINEINQEYKIIYDEKQSKIPVESISIEPTQFELKPKETLQLQVSILPANATNKAIKFESFNTGLATVDENGLVTAILEGEVDIVVIALDNENIK